tara:strand:+ start:199 stop:660 length:462 start_codon:yes stop_codon:yes gene_type:complete
MLKKKYHAFFLLFASTTSVADFTVDNPLNFGEIAIRSNTSVSTVSIYRNGSYQSTNHIFILKPGSPGVYTLSNFAPYTTVNLSVDLPATSSMSYPQTAQFSLTSVDIPSSINMGATGSAQFKLGGTLSTSGSPANNYFSGADYIIYLNINIDY